MNWLNIAHMNMILASVEPSFVHFSSMVVLYFGGICFVKWCSSGGVVGEVLYDFILSCY